MSEVAVLAGVAMSSVSRVLSNHPDVSEDMRVRVLAAVEELGYKPNLLAQSLRRQETLSVGFLVGDISNPLLAQIAKGAESALRQAGYSMLLTNSDGDPDLDAEHVRLLEQRRVDGLILSLAKEGHRATLAALRGIDLPVVVIDRKVPSELRASAVLSDHRSGVAAAAGHLLDLGHRRVDLIVGQPLRPSRERQRGLEQAFTERGLEPTFTVIEGTLSEEHGLAATRRLLEAEEPPTAIIAGGNQIVIGTLRELAARRLRVGKDVSIASCDDIPLTELYVPPISVVRRDNQQLGRTAASLLLRRIQGDEEPAEVVLPTEYVARASTAPPGGVRARPAARARRSGSTRVMNRRSSSGGAAGSGRIA
jgi:LacI family transcriptional regulator